MTVVVSWPGVDRDRGKAAVYHLERAGQLLVGWRQRPSRWLLVAAGEHLRIANGYLGAVGFEHGSRLTFPAAP